jgi:hypothetical protein
MKKCHQCLLEKEDHEFNPRRCNQCKVCEKQWKKEWYNKNKQKISSQRKLYQEKNKDKIKETKKKYYLNNKESINQKNAIHRTKNREYLNKKSNEYYHKNKKIIHEKQKLYLANNIQAKIKHNLRTRINLVLRGKIKSGSTIDMLGCDIKFFMQYIEDKFLLGMNWNNHTRKGWHIDHIIPCASFDLTDPQQQKKCFHYTNLQPLWAADNIRKSDKVLDNEQ